MFRVMAMAIQCSKLRWRLTDQRLAPLTVSEAFYLATKGGGAFFGKVGSFEQGYEFDALVINDEVNPFPTETYREGTDSTSFISGQGQQYYSKISAAERFFQKKLNFSVFPVRVSSPSAENKGGIQWSLNTK